MNESGMKSSRLSILVYSCWKRTDMWDIFLTLFRKYWPDCIYRLILLTDKCESEVYYDKFDRVVISEDNWCTMISDGVSAAESKYVMLCMDDYLLFNRVSNEDIERYLDVADRYNTANIRLLESDMIRPDNYFQDQNFNYYRPGSAYSLTTQIGIWNAEFLIKNMKSDWNVWDFERRGSIEIKDFDHPLLAPKGYRFPYEEGVHRGKWKKSGIRICIQNNISVNFEIRCRMNNIEIFIEYIKAKIIKMNPTLIQKIQNIVLD